MIRLLLINIVEWITIVVIRVEFYSFERPCLSATFCWCFICINYFMHFLKGEFGTWAVLLYLVIFGVVNNNIDLKPTQDRQLIALFHKIFPSSAFGVLLLVHILYLNDLSISLWHGCTVLFNLFLCLFRILWLLYELLIYF